MTPDQIYRAGPDLQKVGTDDHIPLTLVSIRHEVASDVGTSSISFRHVITFSPFHSLNFERPDFTGNS